MAATNPRRAADLTQYAAEGYNGAPNRYLNSSPASMAHSLGAWFANTGRSLPRDVRMSRGYRMRSADMLFEPNGTAHGWRRIN
mgnify:CR=1 FL=1